jgi:hypothetical protein
MQFDRRAFLATLGTAAAISAMPSEALAEALEHHMIENLEAETTANRPKVRLGTGLLFGGPLPDGKADAELKKLEPMPEKPTLVDFFKYRFTPATVKHVLQSATDAMKKGEKEELILACLLHDVVLNLMKVDHGWWGAQLMEPYVSEKVSWGIRYHQPCASTRIRRSATSTQRRTTRFSARTMCRPPTSSKPMSMPAITSHTWTRA